MSIIDLDALMDGNLSEVEAAPDFVTPPTGTAIITVTDVKLEEFDKTVKDEQGNATDRKEKAARIRLTMGIQEYLEYAEASALPVAPNSLFSETFMYDEKGLGFFKTAACKLLDADMEELNTVTIRELFELLKGVEPMTALIKTTTSKNGDREFTNTKVTPIRAE